MLTSRMKDDRLCAVGFLLSRPPLVRLGAVLVAVGFHSAGADHGEAAATPTQNAFVGGIRDGSRYFLIHTYIERFINLC